MKLGTARVAAATLLLACGCGETGGVDDADGSGSGSGPLSCVGIPDACGKAELDVQGTEFVDRATAECLYQAIESGEAAHIEVEWRDLKIVTWHLYIDASEDPPVLVSEDCEIDGACGEPVYKRCSLSPAADLDCAAEGEAPRLCRGPINWCNSSLEVEKTCP